MKLVELLHLCLIAGRSGVVSYKCDEQPGVIYLQKGEIQHAEFGPLEGEDALYTMLEEEGGEAGYSSSGSSPKISIAKSCTHVLLEAARRADEKSKTTRLSYAPTTSQSLSAFPQTPILIYYLDSQQLSCNLKSKTTQIGRLTSNDISLDHESVSSHHCSLQLGADHRITLTDLGSLNGTYINGRRINTPEEVHHGDTIHVGPVPMRLLADGVGKKS